MLVSSAVIMFNTNLTNCILGYKMNILKCLKQFKKISILAIYFEKK